jgi:hypothetical protein
MNESSLAASWLAFHQLVGEAAATLAGLVFVSASVKTRSLHLLRKGRLVTVALKSFGSLGLTLVVSLAMCFPASESFFAGLLIAIPCSLNIIYTIPQFVEIGRERGAGRFSFIVQRMLMPSVAYLGIDFACFKILAGEAIPQQLIAACQVMLLYAGVSNAWFLLVAEET